MAHGKELRVPLLDHNIVNFFFSLKSKQLIQNGTLRDYYRSFALSKFKYNKFIKQKKYYQSDPQTKWLKTSLFSWANDMLTSKNLYIDQLINKKKLVDYLGNFKKDKTINNSNLIWQLICIEYLLKKNAMNSDN
jgi:asparagine synthetase B (glutamine-hydrolysing)